MEKDPRQVTEASGRSDARPAISTAARLPHSTDNDTSALAASILFSAAPPAVVTRSTQIAGSSIPSRRRGRRPLTREIAQSLEDSRVLISLGMSPFMPAEDMIYNQNRFVRNEAILARHLSSLERSYAQSELRHARKTQEFYRMLTDHKARIDRLTVTQPAVGTGNSISVRPDPEVVALHHGHTETRQAVHAILRYISSLSASSRAGIDELNDAVHGLTLDGPLLTVRQDPRNSTSGATHTQRRSSTNAPSIPPFIESFGRGTRRTRQDPYPNPSGRPPRPASPEMPIHVQRPFQPPTANDNKSTSRAVLYGPVTNTHDHVHSIAIVSEALCSAGLSPSMVQSVRPALGKEDFLHIQFVRDEDATRFVELVSIGLDGRPSRQAFFSDKEPGLTQLETNERRVAFGLPYRMRPWQL